MIAYVEGRVLEVTEDACVLLTSGGVGYEVFLPGHLFARLPKKGETAYFFTCTVVREDALELYGFSTWDERETFIVLTSISRIGAKTGLSILSVYRPDDLRRIVADEDVSSLTRVPGIGKKTAQQLFLELKYKLKIDALPQRSSDGGASSSVLRDAVAGLANLGYSDDEAVMVVKKVLTAEPDLDVGAALRAALKQLGKGRA